MFASKARAHPMEHLSVPQYKGVGGSFPTNIPCRDKTFIDKPYSSLFSSIVIDEETHFIRLSPNVKATQHFSSSLTVEKVDCVCPWKFFSC